MLHCNPLAELARRNFRDFIRYLRPNYVWNWHHDLLSDYLDRFFRGEITRLAVFMPPQHAKSELVSRLYPAYALGKNPDEKIVLASYSADLAGKFNRDCQRIIVSDLYREVFPDTFLNSSNVVTNVNGYLRNSEVFEPVGHTGYFKTVGVGGSLTGNPADTAIVDDPVKDLQEAMSAAIQYRNWNWYTDVLSTRLHNRSKVLVTQTRWDVNDLSGKILKSMDDNGEQWTILLLPAIKTDNSNPDDPREIGEALWPERHSLEKLHLTRRRSLRTFEALYQQNPKPIQSGGEFWKGFNPSQHVKPVSLDPALPIHLSLDQNVAPYVTVSAWQKADKAIRQVHELPCREPFNNAPKAAMQTAKWLRSIEYTDVVYVHGDPAGRAKSAVDENSRSFFDKYIAVLRANGFKVIDRVRKSSPKVALSAAYINEIYTDNLYGYSIEVGEHCAVSIEDYYSVKEDANGHMMKPKAKDPGTGLTYERYGHFSDAKRYVLIDLTEADYKRYSTRNRGARVVDA